jgi:uncharacterized protein (DUF2141 family)
MVVMRIRIQLVCLVLLFGSSAAIAQTDSLQARSFRTHNPNDRYSLVMENEDIPLPAQGEQTYSITITVLDIRNKNGVIRFKFFDETTPFPDDKGFLRIAVPKSEITGTTFTATYYGFTSKTMGIALLDDENNNWKLDVGWFFPKEGHAFSDYYHTSLRKPVYSDFRFLLLGDRQVTMKMKYY